MTRNTFIESNNFHLVLVAALRRDGLVRGIDGPQLLRGQRRVAGRKLNLEASILIL